MNKAFEKILERLEENKSIISVNRVLDDIIKDKPKELGQLIAYDNSIKIVNEVAEEYNNGWIPCSERLPEDREEKLVYLSSGRTTIAKYNEHRLPFSDCPIGWGYDSSNGYIDFESETVIAWQPLPEPFKESD